VLAAAGDVCVRELSSAVRTIRAKLPTARLRFVAIHDLTALGDPGIWPLGLPPEEFTTVFGTSTPVLLTVPFFPDTARVLLWPRPSPQRFTIVGYADPGRPTSNAGLLRHCGMDDVALAGRAVTLLGTASPIDRKEMGRSCSIHPTGT
jgi:xylulose-5-phosphate/fructose-6-phosphate phosphoketolase